MSTVAKRLYATDDTFREVADLLFGSGADHLISKMNPEQSDLNAKKDHNKRKMTAALSAVGASAGAAGLALGGHNLHRSYKVARGAQKAAGTLKAAGAKKTAFKAAVGKEKLATGLIPLEVAGLGGEVMATKILHGDTKKKDIHKSAKDIVEQASGNPKGKLTRAAVGRAADSEFIKIKTGGLKKLPNKVVSKSIRFNKEGLREKYNEAVKNGTAKPNGKVKGKYLQPVPQISKSADETFDVVWRGEISKVDSDKRQVFGWASIVEMNGEPVVDLQGDYISIDEIEKSAYSYVQKSRKGGDMHRRNGADPHHVSDMIESFLVTPEKKEKMGLPDSVPTGWWVGYQVHDDDTWNLVKNKQRTGFSIHGSGVRKDA